MTLRIVEDTFRAGADIVGQGPVRLHVNLTERCQLKCAHCITDAPARSLNGTARELSLEVLDAIRADLAHVKHVSLTHAGEPMLAKHFDAFLDALAPNTRVHLLTNGMAMTEERFTDVVARGVRTLSVSLDGLSAATNDVLRIGSRASLLVERIGRLVAMKTAARVGVSWTLTRSNASELTQAVDVLADAGVAWLKVEEVVEVNDRSRAELVDADAMRAAIADARARADARGLALLDHTRDVMTWRCATGIDADVRALGERDDLANGWDLNPCRQPYEVACIEPNGDVRPVSFHHECAGNVLHTPLAKLFDSAPFRRARVHARMMRLCGRDRPSCVENPAISAPPAL